MDEHFDAIVVGSGFGGSVTAFRLAEHGLRVCLLERGKAYPPGSFPRRPREMAANTWDPSEGRHGLFNVWSFRKIEALVSSGLGGGSLIYANVLLRKDEGWFTQPRPGGGYETWPIGYADLEPHYGEVETMLEAQRFPFSSPGYATGKTRAMQEAAGALDLQWELPNLAVTFAGAGRPPAPGQPIPPAAYPNLHGAGRLTCRLCGECDIGCNDGSKNTLDHTYLSAARHLDADIRVRSEVRAISPRAEGGYSVSYVRHGEEQGDHPTSTDRLPRQVITADRLVLAAGALGTPYLLLRNRHAFPGISRSLGTRFCGNGDLLTFVVRSKESVDGRTVPRWLDASRGPVITSFIRTPDEVDGGDGPGFYIEDAGYPIAVDWLLEGTTIGSNAGRLARFLGRRLLARITGNPRSDLSAEMGRLLGDAELSASSLPLLGMGRDVPDGTMRLRRGYLDVDWSMRTSREYFDRVDATMAAVAGQLGGSFQRNPLWRLGRVTTVHPLGGCPMGRDASEGVVDANGEVFNHPGLFIADGAVMPGPVGANPALTIAAFADRMAVRMREQKVVSHRPSSSSSPSPPSPDLVRPPVRLEFTEEMKGFVSTGKVEHSLGFRLGRDAGDALMFHLTIVIDDVERMVDDPDHVATASGWVDCDLFGGRRPVGRGIFNLFAVTADPQVTEMRYRLFFTDAAGSPLTLAGYKTIRDDPGFDVWSDTTTLFVRVLDGNVDAHEEAGATVRASGIITIHMLDFIEQLSTFRADGPSKAAELRAVGTFGQLFLGTLWDIFKGRASGSAS